MDTLITPVVNLMAVLRALQNHTIISTNFINTVFGSDVANDVKSFFYNEQEAMRGTAKAKRPVLIIFREMLKIFLKPVCSFRNQLCIVVSETMTEDCQSH